MAVPLSILDLAPIPSGSSASESLRRIVDLARLAERLGYRRYWFAEHHNMPSIASSAPEILIGHVAAATERIRVGSGGVMLPNYVPLKLAESFHTLEALYPGRIDLGIGRAPGTDPLTLRALRAFDSELFPVQLAELSALSAGDFLPDHPFRSIRVMPDDVTLPPIWLLGSSGASARLAGSLGMGYAFARHFSPTPPAPAFETYRQNFEASERFEKPHAIIGVAVFCAETDRQADYLAKSMDLAWARIHTGNFGPLPSPEEALAHAYSPVERAAADRYRELVFVGSPGKVRKQIELLVEETGADEVMVTSMIHSHTDRLRSYELLAEAFELASKAERTA